MPFTRSHEIISNRQLGAIHERIIKAQDRSKWKKVVFTREDPSLITGLKEDLNDALSQFAVSP